MSLPERTKTDDRCYVDHVQAATSGSGWTPPPCSKCGEPVYPTQLSVSYAAHKGRESRHWVIRRDVGLIAVMGRG